MSRQSISDQLAQADRILSVAASDPELQTALAVVGYDAAELAHGREVYAAAHAAHIARHAAHGAQLGATAAVNDLRATVDQQVSSLTQIARAVFIDSRAIQGLLGISAPRRKRVPANMPDDDTAEAPTATKLVAARHSRAQSVVLARARQLYTSALDRPDITAALTKVGYTHARLEAERGCVTRLEVLDADHERIKGAAKRAVTLQRAALHALDIWTRRFRGIARVALRERPDLLDKLGL